METYENVDIKIDNILEKIENYATDDTIFEVKQIRDNFTKKIEDFHKEGRKLNIGVIGRVKAGKSSFLNTLLFNGEEVLPKSATPKTATLTKMEYSDENRVVVEFYTQDEWSNIEEDAKLGDKNEVTKSAKDLVDTARRNGLNVVEILKNGNIDKTFEEYSELLQFLNDFVGENGKYTALVRSVIIYMNREEFKDISIVDTPGLNDPIPSRTQRTKEFIEVCDVVFFLSRTGSFLDKDDLDIVCRQLPQKGVKKIVLVASQYDSGLRDVLKKEEKQSFFGNEPSWRTKARATTTSNKATNLVDARKIIASSLEGRIAEEINKIESQPDANTKLLNILKECKTPILISSRAHDMSVKEIEDYSAEEKNDWDYFKAFITEKDAKSELAKIGNFDEIRNIFETVKDDKQRLLAEKEREFIPTVYLELENYFKNLQKQESLRLECLKANDRDSLEEQQNIFESKINAIQADVGSVFFDVGVEISDKKAEVKKSLLAMSTEATKLETRTGTETHTRTSYKFSLGPIRLGRTTSSWDSTYTYLAASDALEQINTYGKATALEIEEVFRQTTDLKVLRRRLLETVVKNFDASDSDFDSNYFRIVVQNALNDIEFPEVHIDVSEELNQISNRFSGEIRNSNAQDEFRRLLNSTVENLYNSIVQKFSTTVDEFKVSMKNVGETVSSEILDKVSKEFENIKNLLEEKDAEIEKSNTYLKEINLIVSKF